jgi:hypothetical protein
MMSESPTRYVLKKDHEKRWGVFNETGSQLKTFSNWQAALDAVQAMLRVHPFFEFKRVYCLSDAESVVETNFLERRQSSDNGREASR